MSRLSGTHSGGHQSDGGQEERRSGECRDDLGAQDEQGADGGHTYLAAHHAHIRGRRGLPKAVGATRHDLLIAYWHVVHGQVDYTDLGHDWAQRRRSTEHRTRRLIHQL